MKRKPWSIIILAVLHIFAPLGNLIINAFGASSTIATRWNLWVHIMPKPLLFSYVVLPILAGIFIYICKRWSYWAYLICLVLIFAANAYSFSTRADLNSFLLLMLMLVADVLAVAYFVLPAVRNVYLDPRLRWWEAAPRYTFVVSLDVNGQPDNGSIKNISAGGLFAITSVPLTEGQMTKLAWLFEGHVYQADAKVVYKSQRSQIDGYGMQFVHNSESEKALKLLCAQLRERGLLVPERVMGPEDSFIHWLKNLFTKHEGLFPK